MATPQVRSKLQLHDRPISRIAIERRRCRLVASACDDGTLRLSDFRTGEVLSEASSSKKEDDIPRFLSRTLRGLDGERSWHSHLSKKASTQPNGHGHSDTIYGLDWLPDDDRLLVSGATDGYLKIWDAGSAKLEAVLTSDLHAPIWAAAVGGMRPQVAVALGDNTVRLFDLRSGSPVNTLQGHQKPPLTVVWDTLNSQRLYSGGMDGTIRAWDSRMGARSLFLFDPFADEEGLPLKKFQSEDFNGTVCNKIKGGLKIQERGATFQPYRFKSVKRFLGTDQVSVGHSTRVFHSESVGSITSENLLKPSKVGDEERLREEHWQRQTEKRSRHFLDPPRRSFVHDASAAHRGAVLAVLFISSQGSAASQRLLSCGVDGKVRAWDAKNGTPSQATCNRDSWQSSINVECWQEERPFQLAASNSSDNLVFVPEKEHVAVYSLEDGQLLSRISGHQSTVTCVQCLSPSKRLIATASEDGSVMTWNMPSSVKTEATEVISLD